MQQQAYFRLCWRLLKQVRALTNLVYLLDKREWHLIGGQRPQGCEDNCFDHLFRKSVPMGPEGQFIQVLKQVDILTELLKNGLELGSNIGDLRALRRVALSGYLLEPVSEKQAQEFELVVNLLARIWFVVNQKSQILEAWLGFRVRFV